MVRFFKLFKFWYDFFEMNYLCLFVVGRKLLLVGGCYRDILVCEGRLFWVFIVLFVYLDGKEFLVLRLLSNVLVYKEVNGLDLDLFFGFIEYREIYLWI